MDDFFPRCQHLTLNGARCTAPALNDKDFCFDHHYRRIRRARNRQPWHPGDREVAGPRVTLVYMEDPASVIENINLIAQAFAEHSIDHRQVGSLTYLMNTALKALNHMSKLEKTRPDDMPTRVTHDDFDEPIAAPDAARVRSKKIADSQPQSNPEPTISDHASQPTDHAWLSPASSLPSPDSPAPIATPDACHAESAQAGEASAVASSNPEPAVSDHASRPTDHASTDQAAALDDAARHAPQGRQYSESFRRLNPWLFPQPNPTAEPSQDSACLELNAAAEPEPVSERRTRSAERPLASSLPLPILLNAVPRTPNARSFSHLPYNQRASAKESITCTPTFSATRSDSTRALNNGGTPQTCTPRKSSDKTDDAGVRFR